MEANSTGEEVKFETEKILTKEETKTATIVCPHCHKTVEQEIAVKVIVDQTPKEGQVVNVNVSLIQRVSAPKGNWFTNIFRRPKKNVT